MCSVSRDCDLLATFLKESSRLYGKVTVFFLRFQQPGSARWAENFLSALALHMYGFKTQQHPPFVWNTRVSSRIPCIAVPGLGFLPRPRQNFRTRLSFHNMTMCPLSAQAKLKPGSKPRVPKPGPNARLPKGTQAARSAPRGKTADLGQDRRFSRAGADHETR